MRWKFADMASGEIVTWQQVCAEKELDSLLDHIGWNPMVDLAKLFTSLVLVLLIHCCCRLGPVCSCDLVGSTHPIRMIQSKLDVSSPCLA
jgi:hypothetical protein